MKKPIRKFAILLWIAAALFLLGDTALALYIKQFSADMAHTYGRAMVDELTLVNLWNSFRGAIVGAGELAGLGVLIELVDQIRWNALDKPKTLD
jgi:hypothetical protein